MSESQDLLLQANALTRFYADYPAVDAVDVSLRKGEVLGLLGPNGAGKSTTLQMLTGNLAPSSGEIKINGHDLIDNPLQAKRALGYLPEQPPVYRDMTVLEYLRYCGRLHDVEKNKLAGVMETAMQRCALTDVSQRLIGNLSKGYQQRVGIAQAIIHQPDVVILDEPTVGLDPIQIAEIRELIRELGNDHSVILSTHILPEVEAVCDRVQLIHQGKTVFADKLSTLGEIGATHAELIVCIDGHVDIAQLNTLEGVAAVNHLDHGRYTLECEADMELKKLSAAVFDLAKQNDWVLLELTPQMRSLEQVFMQLVHQDVAGKDIEDADSENKKKDEKADVKEAANG